MNPLMKLKLINVTAACASTVALFLLILSVSDADPSTQSLQPAFRADQFTDFVGISASPFETYLASGPYAGAGTKYPLSFFTDLGIRHYRTGLKNELTLPNQPQLVSQAYDRFGVQATVLIDPHHNFPADKLIGTLKQYEPGSIDMIEGPNEVNNKFPPQDLNLKYGGTTDEAAGTLFMNDAYKAIKADDATKNIGVIAFTAIFTDYHLAKPCSSFDFANMHSYQGYNIPSSSIEMNETRFNNILPTGSVIKPFMPTECGYNVETDKSNGTFLTGSLRAQALSIPMLLAEYFRHGIKRAYLFAIHNADGYGLLESDQTTKRPSYFALKNFMSEIKDSTWNGSTHRWVGCDIVPKALLFSIQGAPATVHTVTLQKHNGEYLLLIWNEVPEFNPDSRTDIVNPAVPLTIHFRAPLRTVTLLTQNDAGSYDASLPKLSANTVMINVPASVAILRIVPARNTSAAPVKPVRNLSGTGAPNSIKISWNASSIVKRIAGYFVYRNGEFLTSTTNLSFSDESSWVMPGLGYTYSVQAFDAGGNMSPLSSVVVTTPDKRPDLICSDVVIPQAKPGDPVVFQATLKNVGDGPTPADTVSGLTFFVDGQYTTYGTTDGTPLAPGQSIVLSANGGRGGNTWKATPGMHVLHVQVDDIDRVSDEKSKTNNNVDRSFIVGGDYAGMLSGAADPIPYRTDLNVEGTEDWVHWGLSDKSAVTRKSTGDNAIGALNEVGSGYMSATPGCAMSVAWTGGSPVAQVNDSHAGLWLNGLGSGYTFAVPADTSERTLRVYVSGINGAAGTFTAHLSDSSSPDYVSQNFDGNLAKPWSPVPDGFGGVYTLHYRAASAGQHLQIAWTLSGDPNRFAGQLRLQCATLARSSTTTAGR